MRRLIAVSSAVDVIQLVWKERMRRLIAVSSAVDVMQLVWKERMRRLIAVSSAVDVIQLVWKERLWRLIAGSSAIFVILAVEAILTKPKMIPTWSGSGILRQRIFMRDIFRRLNSIMNEY